MMAGTIAASIVLVLLLLPLLAAPMDNSMRFSYLAVGSSGRLLAGGLVGGVVAFVKERPRRKGKNVLLRGDLGDVGVVGLAGVAVTDDWGSGGRGMLISVNEAEFFRGPGVSTWSGMERGSPDRS